ncbi:MAG TPA: sterol desaturase family protein, partial [Thermoanaerobaculia bacterium]
LWRFHAIHHSSESLDWLAAARVHPVNEALGRILQLVPMFLLGFDPRVVAAAVPLLTFYAVFLHANVPWDFGPLRYVIATPRFHRWHHTSESEGLDKNFAGLFPWIDVLFGTFYMPDRQPQTFGVKDSVPAGFLAQLAYPFRRSA